MSTNPYGSEPMTPEQAKARLREWGQETQAEVQAAIAKLEARASEMYRGAAPWMTGGALLIGLLTAGKLRGAWSGRGKRGGVAGNEHQDEAQPRKSHPILVTALGFAAKPLLEMGKRMAFKYASQAASNVAERGKRAVRRGRDRAQGEHTG